MSDVLRVDPQRLTAIREAYDRALDELEPQLDHLRYSGLIRTPWLGDDASKEVVAHYNNTVMSGALDARATSSGLGAYAAMSRYATELKAIRDQFAAIEQSYPEVESTNTKLARPVD